MMVKKMKSSRKLWMGLGLIFFSFQLFAQEFQHGRLHFTTDPVGYYYTTQGHEIRKYNALGDLQFSYSNNLLGEIASVDASNSQKVLVYFKDFTKILILDNTLSSTGRTIDLTDLQLEETSLVCNSYGNGFWLYDPVRYELIRKNDVLATTNSSGNIANLLDQKVAPNYMVEYNNRLYLNDPKLGILVFDIYGAFIKTIGLLNLSNFQVKENYILFLNDSLEIVTYDFLRLEVLKFDASKHNDMREVRIEGDKIYLLNSNNEVIVDKIQ